MYTVSIVRTFSSAHSLREYKGKCEALHGHNWKVRVAINCQKIDEIGLTIDFGIVKKILSKITDKLDHQLLNELEMFQNVNPTSENIARYFYDEMSKKISINSCKLVEIEIWESDKSSLIYSE